MGFRVGIVHCSDKIFHTTPAASLSMDHTTLQLESLGFVGVRIGIKELRGHAPKTIVVKAHPKLLVAKERKW
jgi:hypothetical protein